MPRHLSYLWVGPLAALAAVLSACSLAKERHQTARTATDAPRPTDPEPRDYPGLHNVVAFAEGYYSGGVPDGETGFDALQALGVRTVISVDGAVPDVEAANARGIRYIHLPIGYDGFEEGRKLALARASRDARALGPVYVHCHHGKHRSAGAAGAAAVTLGWATPQEMVQRMRVSGTSEHYTGLYACTADARPIPADRIDAVDPDFPAISRPTGMVKGMVEINRAYEHLKQIKGAGWTAPPEHPDLVPAAEAGRLADLLRYLADDSTTRREPPEFRRLMLDNWKKASDLEAMMTADASEEELGVQFKLVAASCKACHANYRD